MKFLPLLFMTAALLLTSFSVQADGSPSYTVPMTQDEDPLKIDKPPRKHRMPSKRMECTITPEGVYSSSFDIDEVILFEVYDACGNILSSFTDEASFISFIFSMSESEPFEIRLYFEEYVLYGRID